MEQNRGGITSWKCAQLAGQIVASAAPLERKPETRESLSGETSMCKALKRDRFCARPLKGWGRPLIGWRSFCSGSYLYNYRSYIASDFFSTRKVGKILEKIPNFIYHKFIIIVVFIIFIIFINFLN